MAKAPRTDRTRAGRADKVERAKRYVVLGSTRDGVKVLEPRVPPTHFSRDQIRETVERIVARRRALGEAAERGDGPVPSTRLRPAD